MEEQRADHEELKKGKVLGEMRCKVQLLHMYPVLMLNLSVLEDLGFCFFYFFFLFKWLTHR